MRRTARLCTDNGVMVAWAGIERLKLGALDDPTDMEVRARWPLGVSHTPSDGSIKVTSTKHTKLTSTRVVATPAAAAEGGDRSELPGVVVSGDAATQTEYHMNKNPWDL